MSCAGSPPESLSGLGFKPGVPWGTGSGGECATNEQHLPSPPLVPRPLWRKPLSQDRGAPKGKAKLSAPKGCWTLWSGRGLKSHLVATSPGPDVSMASLLP